jgi:hypothetical protein
MCRGSVSVLCSLSIEVTCSEIFKISRNAEFKEGLVLMSACGFTLARCRCSCRPVYFTHLFVDNDDSECSHSCLAAAIMTFIALPVIARPTTAPSTFWHDFAHFQMHAFLLQSTPAIP